jgi:hypothetical protein
MIALKDALPLVEKESEFLAAVHASLTFGTDNYWTARNAALAEVAARLEKAGAKTRRDTSEGSIRFAGLRASSTMGLEGAIRNWLTAARKRLASVGRDAS